MDTNIKDKSPQQRIGFIFDLDGTILDSMDFFLKKLPKKISSHYNINFTPEISEKFNNLLNDVFGGKHSGGKSLIIKMLVKTAKIFGIPWYKWIGLFKLFKYYYYKEISDVKVIAGSGEMLDRLVENYNILLGISTTGSEEEILDRFQNKMSFLDRFKGNILGRDSVKYSKPSPEGIFTLSKKWGISPKRTVMIGDFYADIKAGKAAGSITIGVLTGFSTRESMEINNPDFILNDITEIPSIMGQILMKINKI